MARNVSPLIHVPDVTATMLWYQSIGFELVQTGGEDGAEVTFAMLRWGSGDVLFSAGGKPSSAERREVDLYVYAEDVAGLFERLKGKVEVVEELHDTFYAMREFIVRDCNRFWLTFAEPVEK